MPDSRTFKLDAPHMHGDDVAGWQATLNRQMKTWDIRYSIKADGDYGAVSRDLTATVLFGMGISHAAMVDGVTPELRTKIRHRNLTATELALFTARVAWRAKLRKTHNVGGQLATPIAKIISSSWGYHPPGHDGVDLICRENAPLYAICDGTIVRADAGGWWGKAAPADAALKARGDGIIIVRCTINAGPFREGLNFCYGHAEHAIVKAGDHVQAGQHIGTAGFANMWHSHFMVNARGDTKGVGDRDPMPYVNYARKHG
jgi:murein DD-endopeptidase MepM/ murein hydrolase activator NlpD